MDHITCPPHGSYNFSQTRLVWNSLNLSNIFLLDVNFENPTVGLHVFIWSFIFAKFQVDQRSIVNSSIKYLNSSFCDIKLYIKNKFINRIINNIQFDQNLTYMLRL